MTERWYQKAIIYCLDAETFQDSDGDGAGDFAGLTRRLDYLARLGVDCLWLNPIHPSPGRDGGYDVTDYYTVHPRLGTLGDFAVFLQAADSRGIRVIIDLVVNHTSDEHPWFRSARSAADSPYRDWYVWSEREPTDRRQGMVFPGEQRETWTYDKTAGAWYYHRFYRFQPDLNISNPRVRDEIKKIASFWLRLGVAGFRMDAVPFLIESTNPDGSMGDKDFGFLTELRQHVQWQRRDALLLAEANVDPDQLTTYFGDSGGSANRLHMLFDFLLNGQIMLALARQDPEPVIEALRDTPPLPAGSQWATFLRNHDEVDLSRLTADQRQDRAHLRHCGEPLEEAVAGPEHDRGPQDHGVGIDLAHRRLADLVRQVSGLDAGAVVGRAVVVHEPGAVAGITNRVLAPVADRVVVGMNGIRVVPESKERDRLDFAFMSNGISSERQVETAVRQTNALMRQALEQKPELAAGYFQS